MDEKYSKKFLIGEKFAVFMPILYSFGFILSQQLDTIGMGVSLVSAILFLVGYFLINHTLENTRIKITVFLIISYSLISLFFTLDYDYLGLRSVFLNPALILPFLCPFLTTRDYNTKILNYIIVALEVAAILYIILAYLNFTELIFDNTGKEAIKLINEDFISFDIFSKNFGACLGLGLLLANYLKRRTLIIILVGFLINLLMAVYLGRRNIVFTNSLYVVIACYLYIKYANINPVIRSILFCTGILFLYYGIVNFRSFIEEADNTLFTTFASRIDDDTRSQVLEDFYNDMNTNTSNWVIGKGINSTYYSLEEETDTSTRKTIETGALHIILKIGIIGLLLYLLILMPAIFKHKNNLFTKALASYILIGIIELYPAGVPIFSLQFVLLWIAASICYNKKFINMSEDTSVQIFKSFKY